MHITNIHRHDAFRTRSYISGVAAAVIVGAGPTGYLMAVQYLAR